MPEPEKEQSGGLSIQTLLISAGAAVAAATIVPMIWERGTILATAMTPVVVALVSEALKKPVQTAASVAPKVARRSGTGAAVRRFEPDAAQTRHHERVGARGEGPERFEPLPPGQDAPPPRGDDPFGLREPEKSRGRHWKVAVVTGLLAFVIAAGFITVTELAAGGSVSSDRRTSLWGGQKRDATPTPTATPTESATPDEGEPTPTPTATETPEATATATPTPTVSATPTPVVPAPQTTPVPTP